MMVNRKRSRSVTQLAAGLIAWGSTQACKNEPEVAQAVPQPAISTPAPRATLETGFTYATDAEDGVKVTVLRDTWSGATDISKHVTPIKVRISNNADKSVRVTYNNLQLEGRWGRDFDAVSPFKVEGTVQKLVTVRAYEPIAAPHLVYHEFYVDPHYDWVYPGIGAYDYDYDVYYDPDYYTSSYSYWKDTKLPTSDMLSRALPEGVIKPRGSVEGYVYFEKMDTSTDKMVELEVDLVDADSGKRFTSVDVEFELDKYWG